MSKFFPENVSVTGYNMKITRYRKSILKIPVWPGLRSLSLLSKFIRQFEFSENLEDLYEDQGLALQQLFSIEILCYF